MFWIFVFLGGEPLPQFQIFCIPLNLTISPLPVEEKQSDNIKLIPSFLTLGMVNLRGRLLNYTQAD